MKNYTENKFFALVDKYPVIKSQLIQQYGGVEKFELKKQELIKKQGISNQK